MITSIDGALRPEDCLLAVLSYDNGENLRLTLNRIPKDLPCKVLVHIDGSTDGSDACVGEFPFPVLRTAKNTGIGRSIKNVINYAKEHRFKAICIIPGNHKNNPAEAMQLLNPIIAGSADYVQGSRFLQGGSHEGTPFFRLLGVRLYSLFFSLLTLRRSTDVLEGYRAYNLAIFDDPRIQIGQDWLDSYEFETYLHWKVLTGSQRYAEAPTSKVYSTHRRGWIRHRDRPKYTHIRPVIDWWRIMRPLFFLALRLKY